MVVNGGVQFGVQPVKQQGNLIEIAGEIPKGKLV
jgi:hypothetical protein